MKESKKPDLEFKRNINFVSYEFGTSCDIKLEDNDDIKKMRAVAIIKNLTKSLTRRKEQ